MTCWYWHLPSVVHLSVLWHQPSHCEITTFTVWNCSRCIVTPIINANDQLLMNWKLINNWLMKNYFIWLRLNNAVLHFLFFVEANEKWDNSKYWKHFTFQLNQPSWSCWLFHKACHGQTLPTVWVQTNKKNNIYWPIVHFELIGNFIETIQRYKFKWSHKIPKR